MVNLQIQCTVYRDSDIIHRWWWWRWRRRRKNGDVELEFNPIVCFYYSVIDYGFALQGGTGVQRRLVASVSECQQHEAEVVAREHQSPSLRVCPCIYSMNKSKGVLYTVGLVVVYLVFKGKGCGKGVSRNFDLCTYGLKQNRNKFQHIRERTQSPMIHKLLPPFSSGRDSFMTRD